MLDIDCSGLPGRVAWTWFPNESKDIPVESKDIPVKSRETPDQPGDEYEMDDKPPLSHISTDTYSSGVRTDASSAHGQPDTSSEYSEDERGGERVSGKKIPETDIGEPDWH